MPNPFSPEEVTAFRNDTTGCAHVIHLNNAGDLRRRLAAMPGVRTLDRGPEQGGLVTFTVKDKQPADLLKELARHKINVVPSVREFAVLDFDEKGVEWAIRVL